MNPIVYEGRKEIRDVLWKQKLDKGNRQWQRKGDTKSRAPIPKQMKMGVSRQIKQQATTKR